MSQPIFERLGNGQYSASAVASGPFGSMQGGLIAGLAAIEIEQLAPGFRPLSSRTEFFSPVPVGDISITTSPVRQGRRTAIFDARIEAGGKLCARSTLTLIAPSDTPGIKPIPKRPLVDLSKAERRQAQAPYGGPWLMDVFEVCSSEDHGFPWFRLKRPICEGETAFARALVPADWTHGVARPGYPGPPPVSAWPNTDLTVHIDRLPKDEWIGLTPDSRWQQDGVGIGFGGLRDIHGNFGRVAMGVALVV